MRANRIKTEVLDRLPGRVGELLQEIHRSALEEYALDSLKEIRLRVKFPMMIRTVKGEFALKYSPYSEDLKYILQQLCSSSLYAFEQSLQEGFVTLKGGHRVGVAGRYLKDKGIVDISSMNIRISGEIKGCANGILPEVYKGKNDVYHTLIVSPPCCGKTTMLRDLVRSLSQKGFQVGVVDERSEIAGAYKGIPANDLGPRCDVYDACPKSTGIYMMLRAMAPDIIVTDEVGGDRDIDALRQAAQAGVRLIASCHGDQDTLKRQVWLTDIFENAIVLSSARGPGTVERIVQL